MEEVTAPQVEVGADPAYVCNTFMDLREEQDAVESEIESLKPRILQIVTQGNTKAAVSAIRNSRHGTFVVTAITRDYRKFDEEKTIALLQRKIKRYPQFSEAIEIKTVYNESVLAEMIQHGYITPTELREILHGTISTFPQVTFKPDR